MQQVTVTSHMGGAVNDNSGANMVAPTALVSLIELIAIHCAANMSPANDNRRPE